MKLKRKDDIETRLLSDRRLYLEDLRRSLIEAEQRRASNNTPANRAHLAKLRESERLVKEQIAILSDGTRSALRDLARADAANREGA